jgi:hypothetical protein
MKALIRTAILTLVMLPAIVAAQEPNPMAGYWKGGIELDELLVELRIQGEVVTGPISTNKVGDLYIRNGTVSGNTISFTSPNLDPDNQSVLLVWNGQLSGDQLSFTVAPEDNQGPAREFILTRRAN